MRGQRSLACALGIATAGVFLLGIGSLQACSVSDPEVTIGREFPIERMVAIRKGRTTQNQVEDLLGKPYKVVKLEGRKERWRYYSHEESVERFMFFISLKTFISEHEAIIDFDGVFVDSFKKESTNFTE